MRLLVLLAASLALAACDSAPVGDPPLAPEGGGGAMYLILADSTGAEVAASISDIVRAGPGETVSTRFRLFRTGDREPAFVGDLTASCNGGPTDLDQLRYRLEADAGPVWVLDTACIERTDRGSWVRYDGDAPVAGGTFQTAIAVP